MQQQEARQSVVTAAAIRVVIRKNIKQMLGRKVEMATKKTARLQEVWPRRLCYRTWINACSELFPQSGEDSEVAHAQCVVSKSMGHRWNRHA